MTTRRHLIAAGVAAAALAASGRAAKPQAAPKTFVLVHGSWAGGWIWRRVSDLLEGRGHKVFTPTLTGLGERSHLLNAGVNLTTHITDIVNVIKWERLKDIVLVGHSYGGKVITGVAERVEPDLRAMVFLDAFVPESGLPDQGPSVRDAIARGDAVIPPPPVASFQNDKQHNAWLEPLLTPMPIGAQTEGLAAAAARERIRKKLFVRSTRYRVAVFEAAYTKVRANPSWTTVELDCGHHAMVDLPEPVTQIMLDTM